MKKLTLAVLASACAVALAAAAASKDPSADDLVNKYVAARGGLAKIRSVETLRQKGHVNAGPNKDGVITRELKRPSSTRFEFKVQGVTSVFVSDGTRGWRVDPAQGDTKPTLLPEQAVAEAAEQGDFEGPLVDWKAKGHKVELAGREDVLGKPAYKLKITLKSGAVRYEYLDVATSNLVRSQSKRLVRGREVQVQTTFSAFKKKGGLLFPGVVEVEVQGRPDKLHIDVQSIEVNPALSDARFAMPASLVK
jgi:outer membrane lipoprotein-sorting protein